MTHQTENESSQSFKDAPLISLLKTRPSNLTPEQQATYMKRIHSMRFDAQQRHKKPNQREINKERLFAFINE